MKTAKKTDPLAPIKKKLKSCDVEIQNYVAALEKENLKLNKEVAKFQVENVSLNNRVKAMVAEYEKAGAKFFVKTVEADNPLKGNHDK